MAALITKNSISTSKPTEVNNLSYPIYKPSTKSTISSNKRTEVKLTNLSKTEKNKILSYRTEEDEESNEISESTCKAAIEFAENTINSNVTPLSISASAAGAISFYWEYDEIYIVADIFSEDLKKITYTYQQGIYGQPRREELNQTQIIYRLLKLQQ